METVTVSRRVDGAPDAVRAAMADLGPFMRAAGFDDVTVDDDVVSLENTVGLFLPVTLDVELYEDPDADLAYRQHAGMFREMETRYVVEPAGGGSEVTITTDFALDVAAIGEVLDSTVVSRQRRSELEGQLDYLEETVGGD